jgi:hypothetical protein
MQGGGEQRGGAARRRQIDLDLADVGSGHIVDRDNVRAAECVKVDCLRVVRVYRDIADLAQELGMFATPNADVGATFREPRKGAAKRGRCEAEDGRRASSPRSG